MAVEAFPLSGVLNLVSPHLIFVPGRESAYREAVRAQGCTKHKETAFVNLRTSWNINPQKQNWKLWSIGFLAQK